MDRNILRAAREDPRRTSTDIQMVVTSPVEPALSRRTIKRRLQANGLHGRRPVRKPFISEKNRRARVAWARAHLNWGRAEWAKHIWSDESKFNMFGSDGNAWIRRPVGARYLPKYQLPTVKHGGGSCMVWGCFSAGSMWPLRRIQGVMDRFQYDDILENTMRSWALRNELERRLKGVRATNVDQKFAQLEAAWKTIPLSVVDTLLDSMPRRCQAVIDAKGFATKY
uniref:HTH_Tnp_Tc3_2 domain-containing protein n=1 Tax=Caenorhabditis japonica TaxID=281687 RepID=A0A8R1HUS4_CAEJA